MVVERDQPSFYGRFDLAFNNGEVKLLEFNADTPTSLLEASVIQWYWLQDYNKSYDQFNSIHEKLLCICMNVSNTCLMANCIFHVYRIAWKIYEREILARHCRASWSDTGFIYTEDISISDKGQFVLPSGEGIKNIFKLYPYEMDVSRRVW